ncbi:MAG: S8 family serine peptidase [Lachnospiraceae bacterium]|nr:S8 family serine peptidase [Lachnospiraceae bacterium]
MKSVKIAIIDTGVDKKFINSAGIIGGVSYYIKDSDLYMSDEYHDVNGHGSSCAYIIQKHCPNALLYIVKITQHDSGISSSLLLLEALKHLLLVDVDIISISMSVKGGNYKEDIKEIMGQLKRQGKIIVVSVQNGKFDSFPANLKECLGVRGELIKGYNYIYDNKEKVQIICDNVPELVPTMEGGYEWFWGNSKATAYMSAMIGTIICENGKQEIEENLIKDSKKEFVDNEEKGNMGWGKLEESVFQKVSPFIYQYTTDYDGSKDRILLDDKIRRLYDIDNFLKECEAVLKITISYDKLQFSDFFSVRTIVHYFAGKLQE